jgi:hypothetical protein
MRKPDTTTYALTPGDEERFWSNVDRLGDHWWWVGMYDGRYPKLRLESGEYAAAGTLALQLIGTPLAPGRRVRYLCLQKQCVNPEHLGTYSRKAGPWTSTKHHDRWGRPLAVEGE